MNLLLAKFKPLGWNRRALTEADFHRICRRERISVAEMPLPVPGYYMVCRGKSFIVIDARQRGVHWLYTAFHELAHHFLHVPDPNATAIYFRRAPQSKAEFEAEAFAVVALIPEPLLRELLTLPVEEMNGFTRDMLEFRLQVLDIYGI